VTAARVVLVVDDDETYRGTLARALERRGLSVLTAGSAQEANERVAGARVDFASVDLRMPGGSGLELVRALGQRSPAPVIVVLTGYGSIATALDAVKAGAAHYLTKPVDVSELLAAFEGRTAAAAAVAPEPALEVPSLARVEWEHINRVLAECGGNISKAARLLGLQRRSLQRKLAKYPVRR
jgi:two-component system response regulator RegA